MKNTTKSKSMYVGCPVQHALQYMGGKWQIGILWALREEPMRFNTIRERFQGLAEKVLAENLRFFEGAGMVEKEIFAAVPPKVEYRLTADARTLLPVIESILQWSYAHLQEETVNREMRLTPLSVIKSIEELSS
jgi:DNA-binding HxlR family transcriptional regulator